MKNVILAIIVFLLYSTVCAQGIDNSGLLTNITQRYADAASGWGDYMIDRASWLYWILVSISMAWTFGQFILRGSSIQELIGELVKFMVFTGFFWWILIESPDIVSAIYSSLSQIGANASGLAEEIKPSGIVDIGFLIFMKVIGNSSVWNLADTLVGFIMGVAILVILALIAVNLLVLLISGWILGFAGILYLGFGGSRYTSDMAITYYKMVLGLGMQAMTMILLVGIGKTFIDDYFTKMSTNIEVSEMAVMLVASLILFMLVAKIPPLIGGISNFQIGSTGIGGMGLGMAQAAAGVGLSAAAMSGSMAMAAGHQIAGGTSLAKAVVGAGASDVATGTDIMGKMMGGTPPASPTGAFARTGVQALKHLADGIGSSIKEGGQSAGSVFSDKAADTAMGRLATKIKPKE